jgi:hypothetical protein
VVRFQLYVAEPEAPPPAVAAGVEESDGRTEDDDA